MDVHCSTCGEPWDTYHLLTDAVGETGLTEDEANTWRGLPEKDKLSTRYRVEFKAIGYEFGRTLMHVVRCPSCEPDSRPEPEILSFKHTIGELLGDDVDAIASEFADRGL